MSGQGNCSLPSQRQQAPEKQSSMATSSTPRCCVWCSAPSLSLKYVLPTVNGKREFCTELCLVEFRRAASNHGNRSSTTTTSSSSSAVTKATIAKSPPRQLSSPQQQQQQQQRTMTTATTTTPVSNSNTGGGGAKKVAANSVTKATVKDANDNGGDASFNWTKYMRETNSRPAPAFCFNQPPTTPLNSFKLNQKLEASDPRNTTSISIATVVATIGPRLRLRLDGSDNTNDFYRLVDSSEIHVVGDTESSGGMLQPPLGFRMNASFWPMFLLKTLNGAEMAEAACFKPGPKVPGGNYFRVGMKLEAVDRKNPQLICVATVGAINGEMVHITFDGWRGAFDYWTRFDSRDLFPVGWCKQNSHPLQPPGSKGQLPLSPTPNTLTINIHKDCSPGPHILPGGLTPLSTTYGPSPPSELHQTVMQLLSDCIDPTVGAARFIKTGGSSKTITVGKSRYKLVKVESEEYFWGEVRGFLGRLGACENLVADGVECGGCRQVLEENLVSPAASTTVVKKRSLETVTTTTPAQPPLPQKHKLSLQQQQSQQRQISKPKPNSGACAPLPSKLIKLSTLPSQPKQQPKLESPQQQQPTSSSPSPQQQQQQLVTSKSTAPPPIPITNGSGVDLTTWSVDQVINYITKADPKMTAYESVFRGHEIDGRAMLLLSPEMMMNYMGLKLGPALKIQQIIKNCSKNVNKSQIVGRRLSNGAN